MTYPETPRLLVLMSQAGDWAQPGLLWCLDCRDGEERMGV